MAVKKPVGSVTRGTTNPNRLRRVDRYLCALPVLRKVHSPLLVDLGFGASPITAIELLDRARKVNPRSTVVGIEIERERVERGLPFEHSNLLFQLGGFEAPLPESLGANRQIDVIRAFNVLRQYEESEVAGAWRLMQGRLSDNGLLIEGTCDEIGRLASWITLDRNQPLWFTLSLRLQGLELPSKVAERLPKALIHRNVTGERIHDFLRALDKSWLKQAGLSAFSPSQRWVAVCQEMHELGWPVKLEPKRWKLGELTIEWAAVAPN